MSLKNDSILKFVLVLILIFIIAEIGFVIWCCPSDRLAARRKDAMERCVELKVYTPRDLSVEQTKKNVRYEVRFEDEFFCPTQPYTVLEALNRAESVLNTRRKPLGIVFKTTPEGTIVERMLEKENGPQGTWQVAVGGSEIIQKPLDKIILQGKAFINFIYTEKTQ